MNPDNTLSSLADIELLELLCSSTDDRLPYTEFVKRFLPDMIRECKRICEKRKLDPHLGKQIAHECFERVRKYKKFKEDKIRLTDNKKAILVYLKRIATNLFNDQYTQDKKTETPHKSYLDNIRDQYNETIDPKDLKRKKDLADIIIKGLTERQRTVVLKDIEFKKFQSYLPDDVTAELAILLKVKPDTIRKIRERAVEKIKKAIHGINKS